MKAIGDTDKQSLLIYRVIALLLWIYLACRAYYVPPVHDETATFFIYVQSGNYIPGEAFWDANNHILNSALAHFFYGIAGSSVFVLRLASLLFFPLFAYYVYKWTSLFFEKYERIIVAAGMLMLHALTEYFGYARGYGMAWAACMGLVYYLSAYARGFRVRHLIGFNLFVVLSLGASLNLLVIVLIACVFMAAVVLYRRKWWHFCILLLNTWWIYKAVGYSFALKERGALYYGGENGFIQDTVQSVADLLLAQETAWGSGLLIGMALLSLVLLPLSLRGQKFADWLLSPAMALYALFWGNIAAILVMHRFMHVKYPTDRTALHLLLLLVPLLYLALKRAGLGKRTLHTALAGLSLLYMLSFAFSCNISHSTFWKSERLPLSFFTYVQEHSQGYDAYVTGYKMTAYIWAFYNYREAAGINNVQVENYPQLHGDFMILDPELWTDTLKSLYDVALQDPYNGKYLLRKKRQTQLSPLDTLYFPDNTQFSDMYFDLLKYGHTEQRAKEPLCFEISALIHSEERPTAEFLLKEQEEGSGTERFSTIHLNWYSEQLPAAEGYHFRQRMYLPDAGRHNRSITLFIYNPQQQKISIRNLQVLVFKMTE